jgi:hypothetical protein
MKKHKPETPRPKPADPTIVKAVHAHDVALIAAVEPGFLGHLKIESLADVRAAANLLLEAYPIAVERDALAALGLRDAQATPDFYAGQFLADARAHARKSTDVVYGLWRVNDRLLAAVGRLLPGVLADLNTIDLSGIPDVKAARRDWRRIASAAAKAQAETVAAKAGTVSKPPLSEKQLAVLNLLRELPPEGALTGEAILNTLAERNPLHNMDLSTLTRHIMPILKTHYGVKNKPRIGYYVPRQGDSAIL